MLKKITFNKIGFLCLWASILVASVTTETNVTLPIVGTLWTVIVFFGIEHEGKENR